MGDSLAELRHHLAGIEQVRELWGDQAAEAARLHIIADLKQKGWTEDQMFPQDEEHYKRIYSIGALWMSWWFSQDGGSIRASW